MPLQGRFIEMLGARGGLEWTCFHVQTPIVLQAVAATRPGDTRGRDVPSDMTIMPRAVPAPCQHPSYHDFLRITRQ